MTQSKDIFTARRNMLTAALSGLLLVLTIPKDSRAFNQVAFNAPRSAAGLRITSSHSICSSATRSNPKFSKEEQTNCVGLPKATFLQASSSSDEEPTSTTSTIDKSEKEEDGSSDDFDKILQTRRTINDFLPDLPDDWEESLQGAIQSAIHAPNHKRTEPWRFHLLGPITIRKVCELNSAIVAEKKGDKAGEKKLKRWLQMPGWVVVTCKTIDGEGSMDGKNSLDREDYAACCCAVQNLCLSLHNAGMGTKWTTGPVNFDPRFGEIVGLEENEYVVGTIWFGTPEKSPEAPVKKKSMEDVFMKHE